MAVRSVDMLEASGADFLVCAKPDQLVPLSRLPKEAQDAARETRARSERVPCQGCGATVLRDTIHPKNVKAICLPCHEDIRRMAMRAAGRPS